MANAGQLRKSMGLAPFFARPYLSIANARDSRLIHDHLTASDVLGGGKEVVSLELISPSPEPRCLGWNRQSFVISGSCSSAKCRRDGHMKTDNALSSNSSPIYYYKVKVATDSECSLT